MESSDSTFIDILVSNIKQFKQCNSPLAEFFTDRFESSRFWNRDGVSFRIAGEEYDLHKEMIKKISSYNDLGKRRDVDQIENSLNAIIIDHLHETLTDDTQYHERVKTMLLALNKDVPLRDVYIPIAGLLLENITLEFGGITFSPATDDFKNEKKRFFASLPNNQPFTESNLAHLNNIFDETFTNVSIGQTSIAADTNITHATGLDQINDRLDYLAALLPSIIGLNKRVWFEVGPPPGTDVTHIFSIYNNTCASSSYSPRTNLSLIIDARRKNRLETVGLNVLSKLILKHPQTDTERQLLRMAKCLGRSMRMVGKEEKFLLAAIALEAAFSHGNNAVTQNLSEGIALVLGTTLESKKAIKKNVSDLYGIRSKLAHGNKCELSLMDLHSLQEYVFQSLSVLLNNLTEFENISIADWLLQQRLGSPNTLKPVQYKE